MVEFLLNAYLKYGPAVKPEVTPTFSDVPRLSEDVGICRKMLGSPLGGPNEVGVGVGVSRVKTILLYHISHITYRLLLCFSCIQNGLNNLNLWHWLNY